MGLKDKLTDSVASELQKWHVASEDLIQSIIQRTFLWLWWITLIVFVVWFYINWLIWSGLINMAQYTISFWISMWLWLLLVIAISWKYQSMNYLTLSILTILFAILEWVWLAWIFSAYEMPSIINAFAWAWMLFIIMWIYWYTTKTDLTKMWTIFIIWLVAIIILTLINVFFIHSSWFDLLLSIVWLIIFLWLVAWDLQLLKQMAQTGDRRLEIVFGVSLYLDFINIFLELLRIFWNRK
jgi:FtsH-binding integral membrane protein